MRVVIELEDARTVDELERLIGRAVYLEVTPDGDEAEGVITAFEE